MPFKDSHRNNKNNRIVEYHINNTKGFRKGARPRDKREARGRTIEATTAADARRDSAAVESCSDTTTVTSSSLNSLPL